MLNIIGGQFKNRRLVAPKGDATRPTSALMRAAVFNMLQESVEEAHMLDLCAGCGAMGLEAISRGAEKVYFVERDRHACQCIKTNLDHFGVANQVVLCTDAFSAISRLKDQRFDLIYIDPPYTAKGFWKGESMYLGLALVHGIGAAGLLKEEGWLFLEGGEKQPAMTQLKNLQVVDCRTYGRSSLTIIRHLSR